MNTYDKSCLLYSFLIFLYGKNPLFLTAIVSISATNCTILPSIKRGDICSTAAMHYKINKFIFYLVIKRLYHARNIAVNRLAIDQSCLPAKSLSTVMSANIGLPLF